jgi:hypothetical protein
MILNKGKKKFLLALPVIAWPFLCFTFSRLGGGTDNNAKQTTSARGLNPELPSGKPDPKQVFLDKLKLYEKAEHDSLQKEQYQRRDPYRQDTASSQNKDTSSRRTQNRQGLAPLQRTSDPRADQLLAKLERLKQGLQEPAKGPTSGGLLSQREETHPESRVKEDTAGDTRIGRLNDMLDKVIRIQHPQEEHKVVENRPTDEILPADSAANTIAATIPSDQTLTAGTTIALRITDSIKINGRILPGGQLVYGIVNLNNDRMLVHISGLREDNVLYATDLQVYDLDGIAGIHIPGELSRDVAKQSADQGVNSLNVLDADPSLGAQAASVGIQTVKTFVGRKVRQVRVTVRAGYQVLLRNVKDHSDRVRVMKKAPDRKGLRPPGFVPGGPILSHCKIEGMELELRSICLQQAVLWFGLEISNHAGIDYTPAYIRWYIRDKRKVRRTAVQELPMEPVYTDQLQSIPGDSSVYTWNGFTPFAIDKEKELILEIGEKGGGRTLTLMIDHRELLQARKTQP